LGDGENLPEGIYDVTLKQRAMIDHTIQLFVFSPPRGDSVLWRPDAVQYGWLLRPVFLPHDFSRAVDYREVMTRGGRGARTIVWTENYRDTAPAFTIKPLIIGVPARNLSARVEWTNPHTRRTYTIFERRSPVLVEQPTIEMASMNVAVKGTNPSRMTATVLVYPITIYPPSIGKNIVAQYPQPDSTCRLDIRVTTASGTPLRISKRSDRVHWSVDTSQGRQTAGDIIVDVSPPRSGSRSARVECQMIVTVSTPEVFVSGIRIPPYQESIGPIPFTIQSITRSD
jgi:hypothetical protein